MKLIIKSRKRREEEEEEIDLGNAVSLKDILKFFSQSQSYVKNWIECWAC